MVLNLNKNDLISLVNGTSPFYSAFEHPLVKKCGAYNGSHDKWSWCTSNLEYLTEVELLQLYNVCKLSWGKYIDPILHIK